MPYQIEEIKNKIIWGDALKTLKRFPSNSIDMIITSPPYWLLRKYIPDNHPNKKYEIGLENSFDEFMDKMMDIMKEIKRILKPTGTCWINFGDAYGGPPAGNKYISEANVGTDGLYVRKMKQTAGAKGFVPNFSGDGKLSKKHSGRARGQMSGSKCLLMMPERFAIRCIDELGFILRNKIIWAKQVMFFNKDGSKYTKGSVMPTSAKDRFNQSYEYLFFFTKSKKYYSNLDAVRIPPQVIGITDMRPDGVLRQRLYPESKYNKFNYRVCDAERKAGQPQFKASQEEITSQIARKYGYVPEELCPVCGRSWKRHASPNASDRKVGLRREFIPCVKTSQEEIEAYKQKTGKIKGGSANLNLPYNPITGERVYKGKFAGREDAELFNSPRARTQRKSLEERMKDTKNQNTQLSPNYNIKKLLSEVRLGIKPKIEIGKNIPVVWQLNPEPHNFQKELGEEFTEHFAVFPQALLEIPIKFGCPPLMELSLILLLEVLPPL